jgi:hypothetical protein
MKSTGGKALYTAEAIAKLVGRSPQFVSRGYIQ